MVPWFAWLMASGTWERITMADERADFLNSILQRGPNKRRIKPSENNELLALALGVEEESEDDEDFELHSEDEEGSFSGSEDEENALHKTQGRREQQSDDDDDDDEEEEEENDSEDSDSLSKPMTVEEMIKSMKTAPKSNDENQPVNGDSGMKAKSANSLRLLVCGICLGGDSGEDDEIVECDNCGICVHESCYGMLADDDSDKESDKTSDSESSTEPWFCDACKSGVTPVCELCPNMGGIFKETLRGQWIHLICALYTPGVTFDNPDKLEGVVLIDMNPSKWGAKECNICEDISLSRTGVCIGCDAGLCKTFFHVTCAQRKGLLSELPEEDDEDVADPLYAHCKLHLDKSIAKKKRQAYLTHISHVKTFEEMKIDKERKSRIEESLQVAREVYKKQKSESIPPPAPKEKVSRSALSSPSVLRHLLRKADLLGYVTQQSKVTNSFANPRRKWHVPASLTVEFVNYFYERSGRMENMKNRLEELTTSNKDLQEEEQSLRKKYQELSETTKEVNSKCEKVKNKCFQLHNILCRLAEKNFVLPVYLEEIKRRTEKEIPNSGELRLSVCSKCEKTENQHLMVDCDTCHKFYHLACVDPPLTRMPKKSKKMLWQCTECDSSSSEEEDVKIEAKDDTTLLTSRQKRNIKEPSKFTPGKDPHEVTRKRKRRNLSSNQVKVKKERPQVRKKPRVLPQKKQKTVDVRVQCSTCDKPGDNSNLVRCDECKKCFHFSCLDPPSKTNPKPKGYSWYCTDCDDTPEEESEEEQPPEEKQSVPAASTSNDAQEGNDNARDTATALEDVVTA